MAEHEQTYDEHRADHLVALLRALAERIRELDATGRLLAHAPELQDQLGRIRSELFHYEVRCTYDSPEVAESRRIVADAAQEQPFTLEPPEDDEPWRSPADD
jgi:hypothetical protein